MFQSKRQKRRRAAAELEGALALQTATGRIVERFPPAIVAPTRQMLTRLTRDAGMLPVAAVVAALREEGVSHTALAMATVLAHDSAASVCLVDLNWWWPNPHLSQLCAQGAGVAGVLGGQLALEDAVIACRQPNLCLLPGGALQAAQRPVVARSVALRQMIDGLQSRFDHLLLDVPALLATSDAIPLASLSQGCTLVLRQGTSSQDMVKRALAEIDHLPMLGVAMNRSVVKTPRRLLRWIPQE